MILNFTTRKYMELLSLDNLRVANDWLNNQEKEGLLVGERKHSHGVVKWRLSGRCKQMIEVLSSWKNEFELFMMNQKTSSLYEINESLKIKKYKNKFDYPTQLV